MAAGLDSGAALELHRDARLLRRDEDLWASDVLDSGTFGGGCGLDLDGWIGPNLVVMLRVEGLGELTNRVVRRH